MQATPEAQFWQLATSFGAPDFQYQECGQYSTWPPTTLASLDADFHHRVPNGLPPPMHLGSHGSFSPLDCDWRMQNHSRMLRNMSPGESHGSTRSGTSSPGFIFDAVPTSYPVPHSASSVHTHVSDKFKALNAFGGQNMPWQPQPHAFHYTPQTIVPAFLPTQARLLETKEFDLDQDELEYDEDMIPIHEDSSAHVLQPEELELSEASTSSTASSTGGDRVDRPGHDPMSEDDFEIEDDSMAVDNDSDSDFTARPKRRRNSRSASSRKTKQTGHKRRSSHQVVLDHKSRVDKRNDTTATSSPSQNRRSSKSKIKHKGPVFSRNTSPPTQVLSKEDRVFPCIFHHFGCPMEFPNKNEWKRHVSCQHLQLGYYRCDLDDCDPDRYQCSHKGNTAASQSRRMSSQILYKNGIRNDTKSTGQDVDDDEEVKIFNDFVRKDLFTQHCRRMHGPTRKPALCSNPPHKKTGLLQPTKEDEAAFERELDLIRQRCWRVRRKAPQRSNCGFCNQVFDAAYCLTSSYNVASNGNGGEPSGPEEKAWEDRMEHMGRHYEKDVNARKNVEEVDEDLVTWGLETGVLRKLEDGRPWLITADLPLGTGLEATKGQGDDMEKERGGVRRPKPRRQPSRTVVVQKRERDIVPKKEPGEEVTNIVDEDADGETD